MRPYCCHFPSIQVLQSSVTHTRTKSQKTTAVVGDSGGFHFFWFQNTGVADTLHSTASTTWRLKATVVSPSHQDKWVFYGCNKKIRQWIIAAVAKVTWAATATSARRTCRRFIFVPTTSSLIHHQCPYSSDKNTSAIISMYFISVHINSCENKYYVQCCYTQDIYSL